MWRLNPHSSGVLSVALSISWTSSAELQLGGLIGFSMKIRLRKRESDES